MRACSPSTSTSTTPAGRKRTTSDTSRAGSTAAVLAPADALADADRDGQLEVVARQGEGAAGQLGLDACQDRQRAAAGRGPAGCAEGFDEDVTLASELHAVALFLCRLLVMNNQK